MGQEILVDSCAKVRGLLTNEEVETLFITALRSPGKRRTELETWIEMDLPLLFSGRIMPDTRPVAERWGVLDAVRQKAGRPLGIADGMIAATAREPGLTVITRTRRTLTGSASST